MCRDEKNMIRKIKKALNKIGFIPSKPFDKNDDNHFVRIFKGGKQVMTFCVLNGYENTKYVFEIYFEIYFNEVNKVTVWGNEKYQRIQALQQQNINNEFELEFMHIPVVHFGLDYIHDTYRNQPLDTKLRISDDESLEWFLQLYDYELEDLFNKYSILEEAEKSLESPKSFYKKQEPHWNGCVLKLFFAAKKSKTAFLEQLKINEEIYRQANSGFKLNLPKSIYDDYVKKVKEYFESEW